MLAAASIAGSFLSAKTSHGSLDVWGDLAMISFVLCVGSAIWVLLPHELVLAFSGEALITESGYRRVPRVAEAYRAVGIWIEPHLEANRDKIAVLSDWLSINLRNARRRGHLVDHQPPWLS